MIQEDNETISRSDGDLQMEFSGARAAAETRPPG